MFINIWYIRTLSINFNIFGPLLNKLPVRSLFHASRDSLYLETGWEKLIDRRNRRCICLMYNIVNNSAPSYLTDILPPRISETTNYPLRNSENFTINPSYRLTLKNSSFFSSTLRTWNSLDLENRNTPSYIN